MRNYSALVVVISSAVLVSATNIASGEKSGDFLFGQWQENEKQSPQEKKVSGQVSRRDDLTFVPLVRASTAVDIDFKEEEDEQGINESEGMAVADNQVLKDPEEDGGVKVYTVQSGDTVGSIAVAYGITTNTILWANDIEDDRCRIENQVFGFIHHIVELHSSLVHFRHSFLHAFVEL